MDRIFYVIFDEKKEYNEEDVNNAEINFLKVSSSICKISASSQIGSGFLLKYLIEDKISYFLISNESVITKDMIQNKDIIHILYDKESKNAEIKLDEKERFIKNFKEIDFNITLVEILSKDNIENYYFLNPEIEKYDENKLINGKIYIPYYPLEGKIANSEGSIEKIDKSEFSYSTKTEQISLGSPIFLEKSINVIGIHKSNNNNKNYGDFIFPIFNIIKNEFKNKPIENNKNKKN